VVDPAVGCEPLPYRARIRIGLPGQVAADHHAFTAARAQH
jgi:hypothetical protein